MPNKFENLKALAEKATPGPWNFWGGTRTFALNAGQSPGQSRVIGCDCDSYHPGILKHEDAAYIAAVDPQTVLGLLEEVERLNASIADAYVALDELAVTAEDIEDEREDLEESELEADTIWACVRKVRSALSPAQQSNPVPVAESTP